MARTALVSRLAPAPVVESSGSVFRYSIRRINAAFLGLSCLFLIYALFPGRFDTDSAWMYAQSADIQNFTDWHSPLLTLFMMVSRNVAEGPAPLFVAQLLSWHLGLYLLTDRLIETGRRWAGLAPPRRCG